MKTWPCYLLPAFLSAVVTAAAQDYPTRPLRFIVPGTAGGAIDVLARIVGQKQDLAKWAKVVKDAGIKSE